MWDVRNLNSALSLRVLQLLSQETLADCGVTVVATSVVAALRTR